MKKILFAALAIVMILPLLVACQDTSAVETKYGNAETSIKVTLTIENPRYVPPTSDPEDGEEPEVDVNNPEFFYNGTVELFINEADATLEDVLKAAFLRINKTYPSEVDTDDNGIASVSINGINDTTYSFWEYKINGLDATKSISATSIKNGDKISATYNSYLEATTETVEATTEE